jgi:hypothetical protein
MSQPITHSCEHAQETRGIKILILLPNDMGMAHDNLQALSRCSTVRTNDSSPFLRRIARWGKLSGERQRFGNKILAG